MFTNRRQKIRVVFRIRRKVIDHSDAPFKKTFVERSPALRHVLTRHARGDLQPVLVMYAARTHEILFVRLGCGKFGTWGERAIARLIVAQPATMRRCVQEFALTTIGLPECQHVCIQRTRFISDMLAPECDDLFPASLRGLLDIIERRCRMIAATFSRCALVAVISHRGRLTIVVSRDFDPIVNGTGEKACEVR